MAKTIEVYGEPTLVVSNSSLARELISENWLLEYTVNFDFRRVCRIYDSTNPFYIREATREEFLEFEWQVWLERGGIGADEFCWPDPVSFEKLSIVFIASLVKAF